MKTLEQLSKELQNKQSHVRKSFKLWLNAWANATAIELKNDSLEYMYLGGFNEGHYGSNQLLIQRGINQLIYITPQELGERFVNYCLKNELYIKLNIDSCSMTFIRTTINNIPEALKQYRNDLLKSFGEYDELLDHLIDNR